MTRRRHFRQLPGTVVQVDIGDGMHCYALIGPNADYTLFDYHGREELPLAEIVQLPTLFTITVQNYVTTDPHWTRVGRVDVYNHIPIPSYFIQDPFHGDRFEIYRDGRIRKAKREEVTGLERLAAWAPDEVRERLRDHIEGRPNAIVESMRPR